MRSSRQKNIVNYLMFGLTGLCTLMTAGILFFILGYLAYHGARSLNLEFFTRLPAPVGETGGGMANAIVGSAKVLFLATLIGIPIGFLGGVYLSEYGGQTFSFVIRYVTDLLNGVPSIVIGIVVYALVVHPMGHFSAIAGGVALGIMMIPISVRSTEEYLHAVPVSLREAALALGAPKWKAIVTVVIPAAIRGIVSGTMLDLARVAGETAPLLFTALSNQFWSPGWSKPTATLPVMIFTYAISPYEDWHRQAWAAGFVLLVLVLSINIIARLALARGAYVPRA
ncbi:MAG: phosphate ABC transporter permease PstA [Acidobacteriaceae bacterium]|nr:phosphate ABC transporter permease PstA [Acidobacteriaceae bacterium]MBV9500172.1 phosphate ABC transporter permease PstA [Acidobacteriaceae bacterium]